MDARIEASDDVAGGKAALVIVGAIWIAVLVVYLAHRIVLSSDSMNNHVHVWWIARDLWHHGRLPWEMPVLGHGGAYAFPYGFANWTIAALLWPAFGDWGVTLCTALGAIGCIVATFVAFPELRRGWWAAAAIANPATIEALLFGQQAFAWAAALLLFGIACWRRERPLAAALLVGLAQATHAAIVLPIGSLLVAAYLPFAADRRRLLRWYALSVLIALPAIALVFASPGYADSTTRDRLVNFGSTLGPRVLIVALPVIFVLVRRTGIRVFAPLALVVAVGVNVAFYKPLNVSWQWKALTRTATTRSLDTFLQSPQFEAGATYRVLRGSGDGKLGLYHVLRAGGRLDSEIFPESMAIRNFATVSEYEQLLCRRGVDFVIAYASYTVSRDKNELAVLREVAARTAPSASAAQLVSLRPIERGTGHIVYRVTREHCPAA